MALILLIRSANRPIHILIEGDQLIHRHSSALAYTRHTDFLSLSRWPVILYPPVRLYSRWMN